MNCADILSFYDIVSRELNVEQISDYSHLQIHIPESLLNINHLTHINNQTKDIYLAIYDVDVYTNDDKEEELYSIAYTMNRRCLKINYKFHIVVPKMNNMLDELVNEINIDIIILDINKTVKENCETYKYIISHIPENAELLDYFYELVAYHYDAKKYLDLKFDEMRKINEDLDYIHAREDEDLDWLDKPFITHANLKNKILYKAFVISDDTKVTGKNALSGMYNICKKHGYRYIVIMNNQCGRLERWCNEAGITYYIINPQSIKHEVDAEAMCELLEFQTYRTFNLRDYQVECLKYMDTVDKMGVCRLPCGMGKSIIMISYIMQHKNNTLILVPNISLVSQFRDKIEEYCELTSIGTPEIICLSSKHHDILSKNKDNQKIVICVYNTFVQRLLYHKNYFKGFDLFIDEAHHIIHPTKCRRDKSYVENMMHKMMTKANDGSINYSDDSSTTDGDDDSEESDEVKFINSLHDNEEKKRDFSQVIFNYACLYCRKTFYFSATINEAGYSIDMLKGIDEGCLCKLNIKIIHARTSEYPISKNDTEKYKSMRTYSWCNKNILSKESTLIHYFKHKRYEAGHSIILYCGNCTEATYLQRSISSHVSNFKSVIIRASTPVLKRNKYFDDFKSGKIRCIITVNCISEGVDLPNADEAIFFVDKKSIINIVQSTGRVLRTCKGKESATLTIFSTKDTDNEDIFKNIIGTLNGEFGYYGSIDLRYAVTNEFLDTMDHKFKEDERKIITTCYYHENERLWKSTNVQDRLLRLKKLLMMGEDVDNIQDDDLNKFVRDHKDWNDSVWKMIEKICKEVDDKYGGNVGGGAVGGGEIHSNKSSEICSDTHSDTHKEACSENCSENCSEVHREIHRETHRETHHEKHDRKNHTKSQLKNKILDAVKYVKGTDE